MWRKCWGKIFYAGCDHVVFLKLHLVIQNINLQEFGSLCETTESLREVFDRIEASFKMLSGPGKKMIIPEDDLNVCGQLLNSTSNTQQDEVLELVLRFHHNCDLYTNIYVRLQAHIIAKQSEVLLNSTGIEGKLDIFDGKYSLLLFPTVRNPSRALCSLTT